MSTTGCGSSSDDGPGDSPDASTEIQPIGECPPLSIAEQTGAMIIAAECLGCHSADVEGSDRQGAPEGLDFDTAADVLANAEQIQEQVQRGEMPPAGSLSGTEKDSVRALLACGVRYDPFEDAGQFGACPSMSEADEMQGAEVVGNTCGACHSSALSGASRRGAPVGVDFDTAQDVMQLGARVHARVQQGSMPPGSGLGASSREAVRIYLACGINLEPQ